ncbi:MAG: Ku protein [Acidobacteria bacterium]|nr:Ku protein [Acidobacteriota bacterium]
MAATVWKGFLSFGLISIPVRLYTAARPKRVSFRQIVKETMRPVKQQLYSPELDRVVERKELAKGYEYAKDQFLIVDDDEIKKIEPPSKDTMEILEFVRLAEIDPLYYESSYYAVPEEAGRKAYALLTKAMEDEGYAALAKVSMRQREYTVVIRPRKGGMTLHTMYYADEVREESEYGKIEGVEIKEQEEKLARQLIESLAAPFEPEKYDDSYRTQVTALIEAKLEGREAEEVEAPRLAPVIDLMQALQQSLEAKKKQPQAAEEAEPAEAKEKKSSKRKTG